MVARRTHCAKRSRRRPGDREVDGVEHASGCSRRCGPRAFAHDGVGVESATAVFRERTNRRDVARVVRECNLVGFCVSPFAMVEGVKQIGVLAQRARNCRQSPNMFRMLPAGVVAAAIAVRNEGDAQRSLPNGLTVTVRDEQRRAVYDAGVGERRVFVNRAHTAVRHQILTR